MNATNSPTLGDIQGVIFDLDGTVYRGFEEVPGAAALIRDLLAAGVAVRYATNRANRPATVVCDQLRGMGLACTPRDVITSADATAAHLQPGRAYVIGEAGIRQALEQRGFVIADEAVDYVIVSYDRTFDFQKLSTALRLIDRGARFVATNTDRALRLEGGLTPGSGSLVAAVEAACGIRPTVIGKPERLLFDWVLKDMNLPAASVIAIGDNLDTDIPAGHAAGMRTVFLLAGVSTRDDLAHAAVAPTWVAESYDDVRAILMDGASAFSAASAAARA